MRIAVHLTNQPDQPVIYEADKVDSQADGDGELYVKVAGKIAGIYARGIWTHVQRLDAEQGAALATPAEGIAP